MNAHPSSEAELAALRAAASGWTVRRDRGLSAAEAAEFELWLAADPRHAAAMRMVGEAWTLLDRTPEPLAQRELAAADRRRGRRRRWWTLGSLATAAALVVTAVVWPTAPEPPAGPAPALVAAGPRELALADGSVVQLNAGGEVIEEFERDERRVRLTRGEAHFSVVKDAARPFVVVAGALRVRAVGTAFNVHLQSARVEVLVTAGSVQLATGAEPEAGARLPLVEAGQRAVLDAGRAVDAIVVTRVDAAEITRSLAWQEALVRLSGATLAELAREFERRFGARMTIADPELAGLRAGGRLRANDPENFARSLAITFDLDVEHAAGGAWVLRKKSADSR